MNNNKTPLTGSLSRREFIQTSAVVTGLRQLPVQSPSHSPSMLRLQNMPPRRLKRALNTVLAWLTVAAAAR